MHILVQFTALDPNKLHLIKMQNISVPSAIEQLKAAFVTVPVMSASALLMISQPPIVLYGIL